MIVPSGPFLLFALAAAIVFNLSGARWWRGGVLLVVNLVFFASFSRDPVAYLPFAGFLALGYAAQAVTKEGNRPQLFVALLIVIIAAFVWLKRYSFVPHQAFIAYPYVLVGFSYVFFRVLHLLIDRHQAAIEGDVGVVSYLNYTLNFTSLVSGPIQRYEDFRSTEVERLPLDLVVAGRALERIGVGYFKVAIVSLALSTVRHHALSDLAPGLPMATSVQDGVLLAALYPIYLYFNFSGYTDVVIGVARFFRIVLPENFDRPFAAPNVMLFWARWHMTLSGWLRTYVFNPLMMESMTRITAPGLVRYISVFALFVTFFLVGLWHGQTTEFLFFGLLTGGGVAANQLYQVLMQSALKPSGYRTLAANPLYIACARGLNFTWFTFTQLWFWSTWRQIGVIARDLGPTAILLTVLMIYLASTIILAAMEATRSATLRVTRDGEPVVGSRYIRTAWLTALIVITVAVTFLFNAPAPDIVYKTF